MALVVTALTATACGGSTPPTANASTTSSSKSSSYPTGPVTLIEPASPGQNGDLIARQVVKEVKLGQPVTVVDRPGGAGTVGTTQIVQSAPDGYTIGLPANGYLLLQPQMNQLPYGNPSTYTPIAQLTESFDGLTVSASGKWKTLSKFLAYAKANPGKVSVEVAPQGSVPNINAQLLEKAAGVKFNLVPAVAAASAVTDLIGGHVDAVIGAINSAQSYIKAHKIVALGVMAPKRLAAYPTVPTFRQKGYKVTVALSNILIAPPKTPSNVVSTLASAFHRAVKSKGFKRFATSTGVSISFVSGSALHKLLKAEYKQLGNYAKEFYPSGGT